MLAPVFFLREETCMNIYLVCAGLFLVCSLMNLVNVFRAGNGISLVLGAVWLAASFVSFGKYRKDKKKSSEENNA